MGYNKYFAMMLFLLFVDVDAQAQTCAARPSCDALGYDRTEADCTGKMFLRCPFDSEAVYCGGADCPPETTCTTTSCKTYCGDQCVKCYSIRTEYFDGKASTQKILNQIGTKGLAATACNLFYPPEVSSSDATWGKGKWYLPAQGEYVKMHGLDPSAVTEGLKSSTGADPTKGINRVQATLTALIGEEMSFCHWTSTENDSNYHLTYTAANGQRGRVYKHADTMGCMVRCFNFLEDLVAVGDTAPQIGDIIFTDKTWSSAQVSGKTPVGIVAGVYNGADVAVMNLKQLTYSDHFVENNYDATKQYTNATDSTSWSLEEVDISASTNYDNEGILAAIQAFEDW